METNKKFATKKRLQEANKYDYQAFLKHLNRVTKNKEIKEFILLYYNNLKKQNIVLKKGDFETVIIKEEGKPDIKVQQELVRELFNGRNEITAEEAFTYTFIHNLKKIQTFLFKDIVDFFEVLEDYKDDVLGQDKYDGKFVQRFITQDYDKCFSTRLRNFLCEYFPNRSKNDMTSSWTAWYDSNKRLIKLPSEFRVIRLERKRVHDTFTDVLETTLLHEIGHVHSKKEFAKFFNLVGIGVDPYYRSDTKVVNFLSNLLDNNEIYITQNKHMNIESDTMEEIAFGSLMLDETINEIYTGVVKGACHFASNEQILSEHYYMKNHCCNLFIKEKTTKSAYSSYFLHADIPAMLKALFPNLTLLEMRNKTFNLKKALNSLEIDESVREELEAILNDFGYVTKGTKATNRRIKMPENGKNLKDGEDVDFDVEEDFKKIGITSSNKLSFAELFFLALGVSYNEFEFEIEDPQNDEAFEIKAALQACLINAHKNNLLKQKKTNKNFMSKTNLNKIFEGLVLMDFSTIRAKDKTITVSERELNKLLKELNIDLKYMHYRFYHKEEKIGKTIEL